MKLCEILDVIISEYYEDAVGSGNDNIVACVDTETIVVLAAQETGDQVS